MNASFFLRIEAELSRTVLPGLAGEIVTSRVTTPQDFQDRLLSYHGAAFGMEPLLLQSAWFRPHNRSEDIAGLFMVGAGTHPGAGLPGVLSSAKALESVLPRMKDGRQAFFLFLPEGEDPDTIVRSEGADGFNTRLQAATPLSQFLFDTLATDVNLATLEGKGRLAERAKPLLAQIPDGAFGDLMRQRLTELTGVGARSAGADTHVPAQRARRPSGTPAPKRSLVRSAITLLLQHPPLALELLPPFRFAGLQQPGVPLLIDLLQLVDARPDITTGALIEHFEGREEHAALQKLAAEVVPGDVEMWRTTFMDAIDQLERFRLRQRIEVLQERVRDGGFSVLTAEEKAELLQLQAATRGA